MSSSKESLKLTWLSNYPYHPQSEKDPDKSDSEESFSSENVQEIFENLRTLIQSESLKAVIAVKNVINEAWGKAVLQFQDSRNKETLLHVAASHFNNLEVVEVLLNEGANPNVQDSKGRAPIHNCLALGCRCSDCMQLRVKCINLINEAGGLLDLRDEDGKTPLHFSATNLYSECAKTLLDLGASLYQQWGTEEDDRNIATILAEYLPDVLCNELDKCISYCSENPLKMKVDFRLLLQVESEVKRRRQLSNKLPPRETELLQSVLKAGGSTDKIITHPVVQAFLHFKWMAVRELFFFLRSVYFLLVILYTFLIFRIYSNVCIDDYYFGGEGALCLISNEERIVGYILYCALGCLCVSEFMKLYSDFDSYMSKESTGILWWILCVAWGSSISPVVTGKPPLYYHFPLAAISVIYSWLLTLIQLGKIPWFAIHVRLFVKVIQDFLRLLSTFFPLLVAFALGYCVLLPENAHFNAVPAALFKTFLMMKGDIDYEGIMDASVNPFMKFQLYAIPAHIIYTVFVITVTMVLTALLVGLAVNDLEAARSQAKVNRATRIINEIGILESIIRTNLFPFRISKYLCRYFSIEKQRKIKEYCLLFSPLLPDDMTLPSDIKEDFIPYYRDMCQHRKLRKAK